MKSTVVTHPRLLSYPGIVSTSLWEDPIWRFQKQRPNGARPNEKVDWAFSMPDGTLFTDARWTTLRDSVKHLVWILITEPRETRTLKTSSLSNLQAGVRSFVRWMASRSHKTFASLTPADLNDYLLHLVSTRVNSSSRGGADATSLTRYTAVPIYIFRQREYLKSVGVPVFWFIPFGGESAFEIAKRIAPVDKNLTEPIEDKFFVPIMNEALQWVDTFSSDVLTLVDQYVSVECMDKGLYSRRRLSNELIENYRFATALPTGPWHPPLRTQRRRISARATARMTPTQLLRELLIELRNACTIVIQGLTGIRVSEIANILTGENYIDGLPPQITVRSSTSGLWTLYFVSGLTFKGKKQPIETEWLIGITAKDSDELPPVVKAMIVLEKLFRHWRALSGRNELVLSFAQARGLAHSADSVANVTSDNLAKGQRQWVDKYVRRPDWPADFRVSSRRWRRTFALHIFRTDPALLPALSRHFKHMCVEITEHSYIGTDAELLGVLDAVWEDETIDFLADLVTSEDAIHGEFSNRLEALKAELRGSDEPKNKKQLTDRIRPLVCANKIRITPSIWGGCIFRSELALCQAKKGVFRSWTTGPDFAVREPSVCCNCENLVVLKHHRGFWVARRRELVVLKEAASRDGNEALRLWSAARIEQCDMVLKKSA